MNRREMLLSTGAALATGTLLGPRDAALRPGLGGAGPAPGAGHAGPEPFRVAFGPERIADLHRRLDAARWPEVPFETGWSEGTNDRVLRDLVRYWRREYDWARVQAELNRLAHFTLPVEGERLHFVWYRGTGARQPFPLLLLHGWPSSFLEYAKVAPLLARGRDGNPGFDVVVPSLPGFVFSEAPRKPGLHHGRIAERLHALMQDLGYARYGVAGGDWGEVLTQDLAIAHPEAVTGLSRPGSDARVPTERPLTAEEQAFASARERFEAEETAYFRLQSTKPQTLAYALQDSPVGLLAWMLEKYWAWSDLGPDLGHGGTKGPGDLWATLDRHDVLTPATLYWLTGTVLSASRIYYETARLPAARWPTGRIVVPTAFMGFPKDPFSSAPGTLLDKARYEKIVRVAEKPRGGHFPALEQPALWAEEAFIFFTGLAR